MPKREQKESLSWWQTAAGVMTGIAALLTAIAGLIVALHQAGLFTNRDSPAVPVDQPSPATPSATTDGGEVAIKQPPASTEAGRAPDVAAAPNLSRPFARQERIVQLPSKREYMVGAPNFRARFTLLSIRLIPHTRESNTLVIRVRATNESKWRSPMQFHTQQVELQIGIESLKSERPFSWVIQAGESMEQDLYFTVSPELSQAELRLIFGMSPTQIQLDLAGTGM